MQGAVSSESYWRVTRVSSTAEQEERVCNAGPQRVGNLLAGASMSCRVRRGEQLFLASPSYGWTSHRLARCISAAAVETYCSPVLALGAAVTSAASTGGGQSGASGGKAQHFDSSTQGGHLRNSQGSDLHPKAIC